MVTGLGSAPALSSASLAAVAVPVASSRNTTQLEDLDALDCSLSVPHPGPSVTGDGPGPDPGDLDDPDAGQRNHADRRSRRRLSPPPGSGTTPSRCPRGGLHSGSGVGRSLFQWSPP